MSAAEQYDAIVIGAGHNGLIAAGYLARAGLRTVVLERRDVVGGAAVSEHPFGPDYTVTSLSYVVSLLPGSIVTDLRLAEHGYHVYPQGPYFAPHADGGYLQLPADPARRAEQIAKFCPDDVAAMARYDAYLAGLARVLGPLLETTPPRLGSKRGADLLAQAALGWRLRGLDVRAAAETTRLFTASMADLLEEYFTAPQLRGLLAVSGVIGTWAGPRTPGTAYVMLHHHVGEATWGFPRGGMGGATRAMADAARAFGAQVRTGAAVGRISTRAGRVSGVALADGTELRAPYVVSAVHPKIAFLDLLDPAELPADFVSDVRRWKSRSGTVKVNLAVDRLPEFSAKPGFDPEVHGGTIVLAESLDDLEQGFQEAVAGRASARPFADICIPSVFDDSLAPPGQHIVSMFTQWVPHAWASEPHEADLAAHADRVIARVEAVAPGFTHSIRHRQVLGPYQMEHEYGLIGGNIFHGELSPDQIFHLRPAAGFADFGTPVAGLYQGGSATHGGGGVTGIPGRAAARRVLRDRRRARWRDRLPAGLNAGRGARTS